jgi:hypothetical protein
MNLEESLISPILSYCSVRLTASRVESSLMLRPTVSRPVCLGIKHPSGAYGHIFIAVRQLRACWFGALSLTRGRVCRLQLLLVLASAVILGSKSLGFDSTANELGFLLWPGEHREQNTHFNGSSVVICVSVATVMCDNLRATLWFIPAYSLPRKRVLDCRCNGNLVLT